MGLSAFNLMRAKLKAQEEARKAEEALASSKSTIEEVVEESPVVVEVLVSPEKVKEDFNKEINDESIEVKPVKSSNKRTDAEKLKGKKV